MVKKNGYLSSLSEIINYLNDHIDKRISDDIKVIIQKLGAAIKINKMINEVTKADIIEFEKIPETWGTEFLPDLFNAIQNRKVLEIYYQPFYEDKPYFTRVHPYFLKEYHYRWYLVGLSDLKREIRTYGLDRILEIRESVIPYISMDFKASEYFKHTVGIISPAGEPPKIRIEILKPQAQYLITQPFHPSQSIESEDEKCIVFTYRVHPTYEFKTLLLGMGSDLKILEPENLKNEIISELKNTLSRY